MQNSALIEPRTSLAKFARSPRTDRPGASCKVGDSPDLFTTTVSDLQARASAKCFVTPLEASCCPSKPATCEEAVTDDTSGVKRGGVSTTTTPSPTPSQTPSPMPSPEVPPPPPPPAVPTASSELEVENSSKLFVLSFSWVAISVTS